MSESNLIFYTTPNGQVSIQVQYEDGSFWLTQKRMAELFGVDVRTINEHLQNIYYSNELQKEATIRKIRIVQQKGGLNEFSVVRNFRTTAEDGKKYDTKHNYTSYE